MNKLLFLAVGATLVSVSLSAVPNRSHGSNAISKSRSNLHNRINPPSHEERFIFGSSDPTETDVEFTLYTSADDGGTALLASDGSIGSSNFDASLMTMVLVHGWMPGGADSEWWIATAIEKLFAESSSGLNIIVADYLALNSFSYYATAENAAFVGQTMSDFFRAIKTSSKGLDSTLVHIIGQGMGAHIAGISGIYFPNIGRITGLDPSGPWFEDQDINARLDCDDAIFVDVFHTDTGSFGYDGDCGDIDIYFNGGESQPGAAEAGGFLKLAISFGGAGAIGESHYRAIEYFLESIDGDTPLIFYRADSYEDFMTGDSFDDQYLYNVFSMDSTIIGFMYVLTQPASPYFSNNYVKVVAQTGSSRLTGSMVLKTRGLPSGLVLESVMTANGGIFNVFAGDVVTVINLPDGSSVDDFGYNIAYRSSFLGGSTFEVNSVTFTSIGADASGVFSLCDAFTIENVCSQECSFAVVVQSGECAGKFGRIAGPQ